MKIIECRKIQIKDQDTIEVKKFKDFEEIYLSLFRGSFVFKIGITLNLIAPDVIYTYAGGDE